VLDETVMDNTYLFRARLTANAAFIDDVTAAEAPCLALGLVEERGELCGILALRPSILIPSEVAQKGFRFGHSLFGTSAFEVVHFAFEFYGLAMYNGLVNPNNRVVRTVLKTMVERGDYFFLVVNADGHATAFRSHLGQSDLSGLKTNLPRILRSATSDAQYVKNR